MPTVLLPASAAAFAPRSPPKVVLSRKVEPWLTAALKRVNRVKRPLNNVMQHTRCLTETLSSPNAIWMLCSLVLPNAPSAKLRRDEDPLVEALFNHHMVHIEAYVVHVDMVSRNEVALKLTSETIKALVNFHRDVYSVDTAASTWSWSEKELQVRKLHDEFVRAANKFVYRADANVLEGLEDDGAGELEGGRSADVKEAIMGLFLPLLPPPPPPPPRVIDVLRLPAPSLMPGSSLPAAAWWQQQQQQQQQHSLDPMESWKVLPSTPPSASSSGESCSNMPWTSSGIPGEEQQSTPTSSYSASTTPTTYSPTTPVGIGAVTTASPYSPSSYSSPASPHYRAPMSSAAIPMSNMLGQPCSSAANTIEFGWVNSALPYGVIM